MCRVPLLAAFVLPVSLLSAQTSSTPVTKAAETINAHDVTRHIGVIADDSMLGRGTPSRGLELTAQYVADQFKSFGLKPAGANGTWFQRYPVGDDTATAPNTVGILEGSDPKLKQEYIVLVAHMDHVGFKRGSGQADSIYNGAVDNASGTAGIIELAEAFTQPGARPRRSLIFLTVGAEEGGLIGSRYFVEHPPVPLEQLTAAINLDMIGSPREKDSVSVHGALDTDLGTIVDRVASAHPDLQLTVNLEGPDGGSDQAAFDERSVPTLFFHTAARSYPHYHRVTDSSDEVDAALATRLLRLVFYVAQEAANAD